MKEQNLIGLIKEVIDPTTPNTRINDITYFLYNHAYLDPHNDDDILTDGQVIDIITDLIKAESQYA